MRLGNAQTRLSMMLLLTTIFFMVEIVVGYITNSMALIADSFHMFSDAIALVIAFISVRMSPKKWSKNTFGWARAEILGALVNAVFLCALCFSILIESIKRFMKPDLIHDPWLILIVGGLGLFINLIGLVLFKDGGGHFHHHGHAHHHHHHHTHHLPIDEDYSVCQGDSIEKGSELQKVKYGLLRKHKSHTRSQDFFCNAPDLSHTPSPDNHHDNDESRLTSKSHHSENHSDSNISCKQSSSESNNARNQQSKLTSSPNDDKGLDKLSNTDIQLTFRQPNKQDYGSSTAHSHNVDLANNNDDDDTAKAKHATSTQMNMRGVFLHVMADALGSVIVMISAIVVLYTDWSIKLYIDPILSVFMVCLILRSTWPLLTESAMILLQTVPTHIQVDSLRKRLTQEIQGVLAVHEFHVWQLAGDRIIASAHIRCHNLQDYMRIAEKVKEFFHNEGIHSTTIQPEFIDFDDEVFDESYDNCVLDCPSKQRTHCAPQTCCGGQKPTTGPELTNAVSGDEQSGTNLTRRSNVKSSDNILESSLSRPLSEFTQDDNFQVISSAAAV